MFSRSNTHRIFLWLWLQTRQSCLDPTSHQTSAYQGPNVKTSCWKLRHARLYIGEDETRTCFPVSQLHLSHVFRHGLPNAYPKSRPSIKSWPEVAQQTQAGGPKLELGLIPCSQQGGADWPILNKPRWGLQKHASLAWGFGVKS